MHWFNTGELFFVCIGLGIAALSITSIAAMVIGTVWTIRELLRKEEN